MMNAEDYLALIKSFWEIETGFLNKTFDCHR
jgi:hypothetical protein